MGHDCGFSLESLSFVAVGVYVLREVGMEP